jgi:hypothetical protein
MVDPLIILTIIISLLIFICPRFIWCLIDRRNMRKNRNINSDIDPFVIIVEGEIINDYEYEGLNEDDIRNVTRGIVI